MANLFVRPVVASTFVQNHLLALKKGSMWQPLMKPSMRQRAWLQNWLVQPCVRASFQQASWILQMWKFLPLLQTWTVSLEQSFPTRMSKMSSVVLVLAFLEMQKALLLAYHVAVGTLPSKRTSLKKSLGFMVMTACQLVFQKTMGQPVNWLQLKNCVVKFVPLLKGQDWLKSSPMLWQLLKKRLNLPQRQVT